MAPQRLGNQHLLQQLSSSSSHTADEELLFLDNENEDVLSFSPNNNTRNQSAKPFFEPANPQDSTTVKPSSPRKKSSTLDAESEHDVVFADDSIREDSGHPFKRTFATDEHHVPSIGSRDGKSKTRSLAEKAAAEEKAHLFPAKSNSKKKKKADKSKDAKKKKKKSKGSKAKREETEEEKLERNKQIIEALLAGEEPPPPGPDEIIKKKKKKHEKAVSLPSPPQTPKKTNKVVLTKKENESPPQTPKKKNKVSSKPNSSSPSPTSKKRRSSARSPTRSSKTEESSPKKKRRDKEENEDRQLKAPEARSTKRSKSMPIDKSRKTDNKRRSRSSSRSKRDRESGAKAGSQRTSKKGDAGKQPKKDECPLSVLICSANLGNAQPQEMSAWIPKKGRTRLVTPLDLMDDKSQSFGGSGGSKRNLLAQGTSFDMVVIGMQESTWTGRSEKKRNKESARKEDKRALEEQESTVTDDSEETLTGPQLHMYVSKKLTSMIKETLGKDYTMICKKRRGQMRLVIMVRREIEPFFSNLHVECENTGVAHVLANKGGIVASVTYQKTTRLSFLSAHLAAHEGNSHYVDRCSSMEEILNGAHSKHGSYADGKRFDVALTSHHCFVFGDLNFRTRFPLTFDKTPDATTESHGASFRKALQLLRRRDFDSLYHKHDELQAGMRRGDVLVDFETLPCRFSPTFKVIRGELGFMYQEKRTPSYTDRILFRSANRSYLKPLCYEACPEFTTSDHKPIRGAFAITTNSTVNRRAKSSLRKSKVEGDCFFKLKFTDMACSNLPAMDVTRTSDPYIMLTWEYIKVVSATSNNKARGLMKWTSPRTNEWPRTNCVKRCLDPVFSGAEIDVCVRGPVVGAESMLFLAVMDYDVASADDLIACLPLNVADLVQQVSANEPKMEVKVDRPLLKNGKHFGRGRLTIQVERAPTPIVDEGRKSILFWKEKGTKRPSGRKRKSKRKSAAGE